MDEIYIKVKGWWMYLYRAIGKHGKTLNFMLFRRRDTAAARFFFRCAIKRNGVLERIVINKRGLIQEGADPILDNLAVHKSPYAADILKAIGAWFLFLPAYSPDLNPIEMVFAKLKALLRKAAARTYDDLWKAVGNVCDLFSDEECYNYFKAAGYETN